MTPTTDQAAREAAEKLISLCGYSAETFKAKAAELVSDAITAALAEREAECERAIGARITKHEADMSDSLQRRGFVKEHPYQHVWERFCRMAASYDSLAAEAERLRGELKEIWSAAFVDPDEISETMARNIVRVIRDAADKALKPQL